MARRPLGVVLIVTLLGWTVSVNQPLSACTGLHSRAAAVVPAGTPPALKPEPSPSHHNCCPPASQKIQAEDAVTHCPFSLQASANHDCCKVSHSVPVSRRHYVSLTPRTFVLLLMLAPQVSVLHPSASCACARSPSLPPPDVPPRTLFCAPDSASPHLPTQKSCVRMGRASHHLPKQFEVTK